jgi:hypothetical protein
MVENDYHGTMTNAAAQVEYHADCKTYPCGKHNHNLPFGMTHEIILQIVGET